MRHVYSRVGYSTAPDSILEFQVLTANYSAQYGRAEGGGVNAVTRSGSNEFTVTPLSTTVITASEPPTRSIFSRRSQLRFW